MKGVADKIRQLLKNNDCRRLIQGDLDDNDFRVPQAVPRLDFLENHNGITYFHGAEFNAGSGPAIAAVRGTYTGFGRSSPRIVLGYYFFQESVGLQGLGIVEYWKIKTDEARVLVLIHELKHDLTRDPHTGAPGGSNDEWNQAILKKCFGITREIPKP